jgi:hypothetical protein
MTEKNLLPTVLSILSPEEKILLGRILAAIAVFGPVKKADLHALLIKFDPVHIDRLTFMLKNINVLHETTNFWLPNKEYYHLFEKVSKIMLPEILKMLDEEE